MYIIPEDFKKFISSDCDRLSFIRNYLLNSGIECPVIPVEGKNHIYVKFPLRQYNPMFRIKTVIAHYDRFPGSPGANDNSAAVFCMMEWARKLIQRQDFHNIRLIFTDGEELGEGDVSQQGAFGLAKLFSKLGIKNDDVFVFDCMGRGNVPVICQIDLPQGMSSAFISRFNELEKRAIKIISEGSGGKWFKVKANYSDNAGFILNGIPACAISMLPSKEISSQEITTWNLLHTPLDDIRSLTPEAFEITGKILNSLADARFFLE
ncbi:MAG: M28 family metallopeptidase [Treponema sp.]|nr:M28 family metallopeptidase [Treponema sp.]